MKFNELAEQKYPYKHVHDNYLKVSEEVFNLRQDIKRTAFIKGLEHLPEFGKWLLSTIPSDFKGEVDVDKAAEWFINEKYGSNDTGAMG